MKSLMQEISIWNDVGKILAIFEEETKVNCFLFFDKLKVIKTVCFSQSEFIKNFEKYISFKKLTQDESLNGKYLKYIEYKKNLLSNKDKITVNKFENIEQK